MRILRFLFVAGLLVVVFLQWHHSDSPSGHPQPDAAAACCAKVACSAICFGEDCQDHIGHADTASTPATEDRQLLLKISREGKRLIDNHETTDMQVLIKQLQVDRCVLRLAQPSSVVSKPEQLYAQAKRGIVVVAGLYLCGKCDKWHASTATGFVIARSGAIATNYHVVASEKKAALVVMTAEGHILPVKRVLAASRRDDLAILEIDGQNEALVPLPVAESQAAGPVGSAVCVISHPANHFYSFTSGIVSRYASLQSGHGRTNVMTITADYARGSSGAPVLNATGQVIGVVRSTESIYYTHANGQAKNLQMVFKNCIPAERLRALIRG